MHIAHKEAPFKMTNFQMQDLTEKFTFFQNAKILNLFQKFNNLETPLFIYVCMYLLGMFSVYLKSKLLLLWVADFSPQNAIRRKGTEVAEVAVNNVLKKEKKKKYCKKKKHFKIYILFFF